MSEPAVQSWNVLSGWVGSRFSNYRLYSLLDAEAAWLMQYAIQYAIATPGGPLAGKRGAAFAFIPVVWSMVVSARNR